MCVNLIITRNFAFYAVRVSECVWLAVGITSGNAAVCLYAISIYEYRIMLCHKNDMRAHMCTSKDVRLCVRVRVRAGDERTQKLWTFPRISKTNG